MQQIQLDNITVDKLSLPLLYEKKITADVLRLDKIHPLISGNKWFKLRYHLAAAVSENKKSLLTFGGAWSNHLLATAAACKIHQLESIGFIRGEESETPSPTLIEAASLGMKLIYLNRHDYSERRIPPAYRSADYYWIDEGGYSKKGAAGAATILSACDKKKYTHICCAAGTGTMTAGLINALLPHQSVLAISVLKNYMALKDKIADLLLDHHHQLNIIHDYHFGGYAKYKPALLHFMNSYYSQTNIPTDFVYTGKLCFAIDDLIRNNYFSPGSKLLIIHSGGLQGNKSLKNGTLIF